MNAVRRRAGLWLALAAGLALACRVKFSGGLPLQTNLLALLPPTERNALAEAAVGRLADAAGKRVVFLVGHAASEPAIHAARSFAGRLRESGAFLHVVADLPPIDAQQLPRFYAPYRFNVLSAADRAAFLTAPADLEGRLQGKLYAPFRFGPALSVADDPLGLGDDWLAGLPLRNLRLSSDDGLLVAHDGGMTWALVSAELRGSSYDSEIQRSVAAAVERAEAAVLAAWPQARLLRTGTVFYAEAARRSAEREFDLIAGGSLAGMLLLLYLVFRSPRPLALGLLSVGFGIAMAVTATVAVFGELHLITLVFGASLIGEAIDYAIQYFAAWLGAGRQWEPMAGLRRIAPGLRLALATSVLSYAALMLAPFPALSQIALFALVGLSSACLTVFLLLPWLLQKPGRRDPEAAVAGARRLLLAWQRHVGRRAGVAIAGGLLALSLPGWLQLAGDDDVRLLISRPPALVEQEARIRELTGFSSSSQFYLVEGETAEAVLRRQEALAERLLASVRQGVLSGFTDAASFVPSRERQTENRQLWQARVFAETAGLAATLDAAGLREAVAATMTKDFKSSAERFLHIDDWLAAPFSMPFRHLWLGRQAAGGFAGIVQLQGLRDASALAFVGDGLAGVTFVDKAGSVSQLFRQYRQWGALWLPGAALLVFFVLCLRYRPPQAIVMLAPTAVAMAVALGLFGYLGAPLTLFNLMALMLVLGVGVNYSIFLAEGGVNTAATLAGVLLSAGTTLLSFGLLGLSSMPALAGFGTTLLLGVGTAVLLAPMVLSFEVASGRKR